MSITIEARYEKKLGLPSFSSHAYALTVRAELNDLSELAAESQRLHRLLQNAVDREIQVTGFLPTEMQPCALPASSRSEIVAPAPPPQVTPAKGAGWQCSGRQRELILTIVQERNIALEQVEAMSRERFGRELRQLSRSQASQLISLLTQ
jgi:hypothetical protein